MKKPVTYLGDMFFHGTMFFTILTFLWIVISPAKYFVWDEIKRTFQNKGEQRAKSRFTELLSQQGITRDRYSSKKISIIVRKKNRELTVYYESLPIATYMISLGRSPSGKKQDKFDFKTPEGQYSICKKDDNHTYHLFLQINYPSTDDASRASINHIISTTDEIRINQAEQNGTPPPADTNLGGNLGIHGFGAECCWTKDGSISMNNKDIEEVFWNIPLGCPITILP